MKTKPKKTTFTPEPWSVSDTSIVSAKYCIAVIEDDGGYEAPAEQREANQRLIAAAPELLAQLQLMLDEFEDNHNDPEEYPLHMETKELIARATHPTP